MKVLHYALGFPPYRSGGLTKFCIDLMIQQSQEGHEVAMLWPGQMGLINKIISIKKHDDVKIKDSLIQSFELINPLPVPFDEGIANVARFIINGSDKVYSSFLDNIKPDIIHIHTLMGIHKSFLEVAKRKKIRLVFSAHDFFPICPKVTMFYHGKICEYVTNYEQCCICNNTALSLNKIRILQSPIYRKLKDSNIIKIIRKKHRNSFLKDQEVSNSKKAVGTIDDYKTLRSYYYSLLELIDIIHYNSSVTKNVFDSIFKLSTASCVISITHSDIQDNKVMRDYDIDKIRIRYLGPQGEAKGYFLLKDALDLLWKEQQNFSLDIHFDPIETTPYMIVHDRYSYAELGKIFDETDILVAPSIWNETFGFTVVEALSYGIPVIISGNVGAKDILTENAGIVIENITKQKLALAIKSLTAEKLKIMNKSIVKHQKIIKMDEMSRQIENICYDWK